MVSLPLLAAVVSSSILAAVMGTPALNPVGVMSQFPMSSTAVSLAIDGQNLPAMAFSDSAADSRASVVRFDGQQWRSLGVASGITPGSASSCQARYDNNGVLYLAFIDGSVENRASVMKFINGAWTYVGGPGISSASVARIALSIDRWNNVFLAWADGSSHHWLTVVSFREDTWQIQGTAEFARVSMTQNMESFSIGLALDFSPAPVPYVVFSDPLASNRPTVMHLPNFPASATWAVVGWRGAISVTDAVSASIAVSPGSNAPFVAVLDPAWTAAAGSGRPMVYRWSSASASWRLVGNQPVTAEGAVSLTMSLDAAENIFVSFAAIDALPAARLLVYNGQVWSSNWAAGLNSGQWITSAHSSSNITYLWLSDGNAPGQLVSTAFYGCPPGSALVPSASGPSCIQCPAGKYSASVNATSCAACPQGYFSNLSGAAFCLPCDPGSFSDMPAGALACRLCPPGTFSASFGSFECTPCEVGSYTSSPGWTFCLPCSSSTAPAAVSCPTSSNQPPDPTSDGSQPSNSATSNSTVLSIAAPVAGAFVVAVAICLLCRCCASSSSSSSSSFTTAKGKKRASISCLSTSSEAAATSRMNFGSSQRPVTMPMELTTLPVGPYQSAAAEPALVPPAELDLLPSPEVPSFPPMDPAEAPVFLPENVAIDMQLEADVAAAPQNVGILRDTLSGMLASQYGIVTEPTEDPGVIRVRDVLCDDDCPLLLVPGDLLTVPAAMAGLVYGSRRGSLSMDRPVADESEVMARSSLVPVAIRVCRGGECSDMAILLDVRSDR